MMKEMVCTHCHKPCWLLETGCEHKKEIVERTEIVKPERGNDSAEAFFYRFLLLDDMKQKAKEERESRPQVTIMKDEEREPETRFKPRKSRPVTPNCGDVGAGEGQCHRCGDAVYRAEARLALGKVFHAFCYTCLACHRFLDTLNVTDGTDGEVYCSNCYKNKFLKDVNRPVGAAKTTSILAGEGDTNKCPRCYGKVFQAEKVLSSHGVYHKACFRCAEMECGRQLDSTSYCDSDSGKVFCKTCYAKIYGPRGFGYGATPTLVTRPNNDEIDGNDRSSCSASRDSTSTAPGKNFSIGSTPKCPRCCKTVYALERVFIGTKVWHRGCLTCANCSRILDSSLINETQDGAQVYCPKCYANRVKSPS